jgi:hypothetical protein
MSVSEQELFGLMAIAQEQQKAAAVALEQLEAQRVELDSTIGKAKAAVLEMEKAGKASALIIEKATRIAVSEAVSDALKAVRDQTASTLEGSVGPSVKALEGATGRATRAGEELREAASSISWKWTGLWTLTVCVLLLTVVGLSMLLVPSPSEIADLRANASTLEAKGGKVQLTQCGPSNRLCAKIDIKANTGKNGSFGWGKEGEWMILQGY